MCSVVSVCVSTGVPHVTTLYVAIGQSQVAMSSPNHMDLIIFVYVELTPPYIYCKRAVGLQLKGFLVGICDPLAAFHMNVDGTNLSISNNIEVYEKPVPRAKKIPSANSVRTFLGETQMFLKNNARYHKNASLTIC